MNNGFLPHLSARMDNGFLPHVSSRMENGLGDSGSIFHAGWFLAVEAIVHFP